MGIVTAICISEARGTPKKPIDKAQFVPDYGIQGDAHAGNWHRQVSLLQQEKLMPFGRAACRWKQAHSVKILP